MKATIERHWPSGVIAILIAVTGFLSVQQFAAFAKNDETCVSGVKENQKCIIELTSRMDRLETSLPYMTKTIEKNTKTLEGMAEDLTDIKILIQQAARVEKKR